MVIGVNAVESMTPTIVVEGASAAADNVRRHLAAWGVLGEDGIDGPLSVVLGEAHKSSVAACVSAPCTVRRAAWGLYPWAALESLPRIGLVPSQDPDESADQFVSAESASDAVPRDEADEEPAEPPVQESPPSNPAAVQPSMAVSRRTGAGYGTRVRRQYAPPVKHPPRMPSTNPRKG